MNYKVLLLIFIFIAGTTKLYPQSMTTQLLDTTFVSNYIGDIIKLDVSLPFNYSDNPGKVYKVVYLTDGYWRRSEHDTIHKMGQAGIIEEVIVVGIGYPDNYKFDSIRVRDLIINAKGMLACIKKEIIPYIENKYKTDKNNRTLWGSSYGGYFLFYAFTEHVNQGRLFKNYICASPAEKPPFEHIDLIKNEEYLWETGKHLSVNLYMAVGGNESKFFFDSFNNLVKQITSHKYNGLYFEYEIIPGTDHYTVWKPAMLNGLTEFLKSK